jgi:hypothetical protein
MLSVALPTWKNTAILWLSLEGLSRQKTDRPWELIIMECESDSVDIISKYKKRLERAGCVNIRYTHSVTRTPLAIKWKMMAEQAQYDVFLLQASDDYSAPDRLQRTAEAFDNGADWYQVRYHYHYSFRYQRVIMFDLFSVDRWPVTGFNMAMKAAAVRKIEDTHQPSGIDTYLYNQIKPVNMVTDEIDPRGGLATDGLNSISKKRYNYYLKTKPPFVDCDKALNEVGIPKAVADRVAKIYVPMNDGVTIKTTGKLVPVVLKRHYKGRRAGNEYLVDEGVRDYLRFRGVLAENGEARVQTLTI